MPDVPLVQALLPAAVPPLAALVLAYLIGSIPFAYLIVKGVTGEDITTHGTGNVGAMNVRRTTGSWAWFAVAVLADGLKGLLPTLAAVLAVPRLLDAAFAAAPLVPAWAAGVPLMPGAVVFGCVLGHDFSLWLSLAKRRIVGGKGLATAGGALLAYDWRVFVVALVVGLGVIAVTRYLMAGQVAATVAAPIYALLTGRPDWWLLLALAALVYARHHRRFVGLLQGREPKLYVEDRAGPRG